jgi:acyl-CoA synthetase (AMP-forming)/AMP-acid ligase II
MAAETFASLLSAVAARQPDAIAYRTPRRDWTFREIEDAAERVARGLRAIGIGPGERVAALTRHTAECVVLALGAMKVGAVCMPVNWRLAAPEVEFIVNDGAARFLMTDEAFRAAVRAAKLPTVETLLAVDAAPGLTSFADWCAGFVPLRAPYPAAPGDTGLQLYSSGTTGLPKGVELSHANLTGLRDHFAELWRFDGARSVMINALPAFHIAGIGLALLSLAAGGVSVLQPEFDPKAIITGIGEHRVTHVFLVPAMILALLHSPGVAQGDYASLELIAYGASPIAEPVLVEAMRVFGCGFMQVYGLTETTGAVTNLPPEDHDPGGPRAHLLRAAGRPNPGVALRIVEPGTHRPLAEGEVGEVWIRSAQNMRGYWRNPKATAAAFPEGRGDGTGWFRSGDAGYLRDGYLYIHDRIKDMIISGGENIYPAEVENALMKHPAVADVAVIGVPDETWGEAVKACVVLRSGMTATAQEIIAFARERIAHYKCPKSVDFLAALPRNPSGKLLKYQLRKPYWVGKDRMVN